MRRDFETEPLNLMASAFSQKLWPRYQSAYALEFWQASRSVSLSFHAQAAEYQVVNNKPRCTMAATMSGLKAKLRKLVKAGDDCELRRLWYEATGNTEGGAEDPIGYLREHLVQEILDCEFPCAPRGSGSRSTNR